MSAEWLTSIFAQFASTYGAVCQAIYAYKIIRNHLGIPCPELFVSKRKECLYLKTTVAWRIVNIAIASSVLAIRTTYQAAQYSLRS